MPSKKEILRKRRHAKTRQTILNSKEVKLRLVVFRSLKNIYAQIIDDDKGVTLVQSSDIKDTKGKKMENAFKVGEEIAQKAKEKKIETVAFDRNGYKYLGRIKALAEGARKGGLNF